jgi:hypothetical protein
LNSCTSSDAVALIPSIETVAAIVIIVFRITSAPEV